MQPIYFIIDNNRVICTCKLMGNPDTASEKHHNEFAQKGGLLRPVSAKAMAIMMNHGADFTILKQNGMLNKIGEPTVTSALLFGPADPFGLHGYKRHVNGINVCLWAIRCDAGIPEWFRSFTWDLAAIDPKYYGVFAATRNNEDSVQRLTARLASTLSKAYVVLDKPADSMVGFVQKAVEDLKARGQFIYGAITRTRQIAFNVELMLRVDDTLSSEIEQVDVQDVLDHIEAV